MTNLLVKTFIPDHQNTSDLRVRESYGKLGSFVGIITNFLLFLIKFIAGKLTGSISITADAINNLSDSGSSVISLISFKLAGRPADKEHPFGHARIEYLSSIAVAVLILLLGIEIGKSSIEKIIFPTLTTFSPVAAAVLIVSVLAKLWLWAFNKKLGKKINSEVMKATAADSLSDVLSTSAVLISALLSSILHFSLDGYMGIIISLLILWSGIGIIKEGASKLLGDSPDAETVKAIEDFILSYDGVLGTHDIIIHNYGPGRCYCSIHVEIAAEEDVLASHDLIDNIERDILAKEGVHLVIHMDPIMTKNELVSKYSAIVKSAIEELGNGISMHDFRIVVGETHTNLIFDVLVPYECKLPNHQIKDKIDELIRKSAPECYTVITFDRSYT